MWTYLNKKENSLWIWTARCSNGLIAVRVGDRSSKTFEPMYESLPKAKKYIADNYCVYSEILPTALQEVKHSNPNEGLHSCLRDRLD